MICTSLQNKSYEEIISILSEGTVEMAEIRLDLCPTLTDEQIQDLFENTDTPLLATARGNSKLLAKAIEAGARFADLELEAPANDSRSIQKLCKKNGTELIRSYHNYTCTPSEDELQRTLARCFRYGADIVKIVTTAQSQEDIERLLSLYSLVLEGVDSMEGKLIAFAMNGNGFDASPSRIECLKRGAPFSYACLSKDEATAPGQLTTEEMVSTVYANARAISAKGIPMPASKSVAQRAIIAAALAEGTSYLKGYTACEDSESAIRVAQALGAQVSQGEDLIIKGIGPIKEPLKMESINAGESGLLARLAIPLLSVLNEDSFVVTGNRTLLGRPLRGAVNIMAAFGVMLRNDYDKSSKEIHIPAIVRGHIIPGNADVSGSEGSQLISGLLMALPLCDKSSSIYVGEPKSIPYLYITQDIMRSFGVKISTEMEGDAEMLEQQDWSYCTGMDFRIPGGQAYKSADFSIEADWNAAAVILTAGAIFGSAEVTGLDSGSLQGDISILDILVQAGAAVSEMQDENGGTVFCVKKAPLEAFETDLGNAPDIFPVVAVLAAFCAGESRIAGVGRLRSKETDRAESILSMLNQMGVEAETDGDVMVIAGETLAARSLRGHMLKGGKFSSNHDHRMVTALRLAELGADSSIEIDDEKCIAKSWPDFPNVWKTVKA